MVKSKWLPTGWKIKTKVTSNGRNYKCYTNKKTGEKFYSKVSLLRHLKDGSVGHPTKEHAETNPGSDQMHLLEANDSFDLPPGWTVELKTRMNGPRKGLKYKCYIDPSTGYKFYSEPEVTRYLKSTKGNAGSSGQTKKRPVDPLSPQKSNFKKKSSSISKPNMQKKLFSGKKKVVVERTSDEELPPGWIKEMRIKPRGDKSIRRDPFYIDPVTGLIFRSKLDVLRYLETGEISKHAYRRKNSVGVGTTPPTSSTDLEKTNKSKSRNFLLADESSRKLSISALPDVATEGVTELALPKAQVADKKENNATLKQMEPSAIKEPQSKRSTRSSSKLLGKRSTSEVFAIESVTKLALPKVQVADKKENNATFKKTEPSANKEPQSTRNTRSSSKVLEKLPTDEISAIEGVTEVALPKVQVADKKEHNATPKKPEPCANNEPQSKRNTRSSSKVLEKLSTGEVSTIEGVTEIVLPKVQVANKKEKNATLKKTEPSASKEPQSKRRTRSSSNVFAIVGVTEIVLPKVQVADKKENNATLKKMEPPASKELQSNRSTRSSSNVLEKLSTGEVSAIEGVTELTLPKVQVADKDEINATLKKTKPSFISRDKSEDVKLKGCSVGKTQIRKKIIKDKKVSNLPCRSSKRLSGVEAEVVLHSIPIEYASSTKRNSNKTYEIPRLELILNESQESARVINDDLQNVLASQQEKTRGFDVYTPNVLAPEQEKTRGFDVDTPNVLAPEQEKTRGFDVGTLIVLAPKQEKTRGFDVDTLNVLAPEQEKTRGFDVNTPNVLATEQEKTRGFDVNTPNVCVPEQDKTQGFDINSPNVLESQQGKTWCFDVGTPIVLPTQVDSIKKNDSSSQEKGKKVISSEHLETETSQVRIIQLFEDPAESLPKSKIEKSSEEHKIPEVQPDTRTGTKIDKSSGVCPIMEDFGASLERDNGQPGSQFCFPSPLWSDPCLEFAFKTLTGAIPLDDNVAIEDYIQHQIRTSEQSNNNRGPDIAMPSFCQNDETKLVTPLPEDVSFTKSNGFSSHKSNR